MKNRKKEQEFFDEQLLKEEITAHIDSFSLTDMEKKRMWDQIQNSRKRRIRVPFGRMVGAVAAAFCCILVIGFGANAASGGKVVDFFQELFHIEPESVQIIENMTPEMEVYAPLLLACNEDRLIFATSRGLCIYDRKADKITATIDLQAIGCNYFTAETLETKIIAKGNQLRVFNTKNGAAQGDCYFYTVPEQDGTNVLSLEPEKVTAADAALLTEWEETMNAFYLGTYEQVDGRTMYRWQEMCMKPVQYSEKSVQWTSKEQKTYISCLLLKNNSLHLYTIDASIRTTRTEKLQIVLAEETVQQNQEANRLPQFVYSGEDKVMKVVCDYLVQNGGKDYNRGENDNYSVIPEPVIFDRIEEDGILKVFGYFYIGIYYKNGNTLEDTGGGTHGGCFHLKEENGDYVVVEVEEIGDGSFWLESIRAFCEGHPDIYQKYLDRETSQAQHEKIRKEILEQYVTDNKLDIKYYHDYGWDPVELFTED